VSLGDCKAYHILKESRRIVDVTEGNRKNIDPKDPGGRIGNTSFSVFSQFFRALYGT
jgi:hypothetical protein